MAKKQWDESLSVGIDIIDEQHKMLIQRMDDLSRAVEIKQGAAEITEIIEFLIDYTNIHFSTEEQQMKEQNYPDLGYQQKQHKIFKDNILNIVRDFDDNGPTPELAISINTFLIDWFIKHIMEVDLKFGKFLKE